MDCRPFRLIGASQQKALQDLLLPPVQAWAEAWFVDAVVDGLELHDELGAVLGEAESWHILGNAASVWIAYPRDSVISASRAGKLLATELGRGHGLSPLAEAVCRECIDDLTQAIFSTAQVQSSMSQIADSTQLHQGYGSGSVSIKIMGSIEQRIILSKDLVDGLLRDFQFAKPVLDSLVARHSALAHAVTRLELRLGEAELSLAEIAGMAVGDVIALNLNHRDPLQVTSANGAPLFLAHLGRQGEHKAVQVHSR